MPSFTFTSPEGKSFTVNGPDGATQEQAFAILQQHLGMSPDQASAPNPEEPSKLARAGKLIDDAARAFANGATFGFADRIAAAGDTAMSAALAAAGSGKNPTTYAENLKAQRERTAAEDLIVGTVAGIGGAVAAPIGGAGRLVSAAPNLASKIAASAVLGAGLGAVQGASESPDLTNLSETAPHAVAGAKYGTLVGATLPGIAAGAGAAYRGIAGRAGLPEGVNSIAAERIAKAAQADREGVQVLERLGPEALLPDAGPSMLGLAQSVTQKPGEARTTLVDALRARNEATNSRITADVDAALGPAASPITVADRLKQKRSAVHDELPDVFEKAPPVDTRNVLSFIGNRLSTAVGPEKSALLKARDYLMDSSSFGAAPVTNAEKVANAKIALQGLVDFGSPDIGVAPGALAKASGATKKVVGLLDDALRRQVPGYASVMDRSSNIAKAINSIEAGQGLLSSGQGAVRPDDLAAALQKATRAEAAGMRVGARAKIDQSLGTKANDLQALRQELQGEGGWNQAKIAMLFGEDPAAALATTVDRNARFRDTYGKVVENSQTAQRLGSREALDKALAPAEPWVPKSATAFGFAANTAEKVLRMIAQGKANFDSERTYNAISKVLTMPSGPQREALLAQLLKRSDIIDENGRRLGNAAALLTGAGASELARQRTMADKPQ